MQVERVDSSAFTVNQLPDGSRILVDTPSQTVFALNATAGAAWDACNGPATLSEVTARMQHSLDPEVTEELASAAIDELREKKLVNTLGAFPSRRKVLTTIGVAAIPLVVSLTAGEQRAHALVANSKCPSTVSCIVKPTATS